MQSVAVHELAHGFEAVVPNLKLLEHNFYWQRCEGEPLQSMSWSKKERGRPDKWHSLYVGRDYSSGWRRTGMAAAPDESYEILSMGMDTMFGLRRSDVLMDDEYRDWLVGVLVTF